MSRHIHQTITASSLIVILISCSTGPQNTEFTSDTISRKRPRVDFYGDSLPANAISRMGTARFAHEDSVNTIAFSPNGEMLISGCGKRTPSYHSNAVYLWEMKTNKELYRIAVSEGPIMSVSFSPDGKMWAMACESIDSTNNSISLWSINGKELLRFHGHESLVWDIGFSPDGKTLVSSSGDNTIRLWNIATGKEKLRIKASLSSPSIAFSPDGKMLSAGSTIYDVATGMIRIRLERELDSGNEKALHIDYSPDGSMLASAHDDEVCLWSAKTGKRIRSWDARREGPSPFDYGDSMAVRSVVFSPSGHFVVVCWHSMLRVYEPISGKETIVLYLPNDAMSGSYRLKTAAFSSDGKILALGCENGLIRMWDTTKWTEINEREGHRAVVCSVAFSPDGKVLASASDLPPKSGPAYGLMGAPLFAP